MIRKHIACPTAAALLLKGNYSWFLLNTNTVFSLSYAAAHAPCFLQHKL